jgi:predicted membrane protein
VNIHSSFGPVKLDLPPDLNAHVKVNVQYGNLNYDEDRINFNRIHEGTTSKEYDGKIGSGSSTVEISVECKYGDVKLDQR